MQVLTVRLLIALALMSGTFALAQDEIDLTYLYINNPFDDNLLCTADEALAFYEALDEYPSHVEAIRNIDGPLQLFLWSARFTQWFNEAEQDCYGAGNLTVALERNAYYLVIQHMIGEEAELPEQTAYTRALEMAAADRELLAADESIPDEELAINLAVTEVPLCTIGQAMAFYSTFDGFYVESGGLEGIKDSDSLGDWTKQIHAWSDENWTPLLEEHCGQMKSFIGFLETSAYGAALHNMVIGGQKTLEVFYDTMDILYDWIAEEMAALESYMDE